MLSLHIRLLDLSSHEQRMETWTQINLRPNCILQSEHSTLLCCRKRPSRLRPKPVFTPTCPHMCRQWHELNHRRKWSISKRRHHPLYKALGHNLTATMEVQLWFQAPNLRPTKSSSMWHHRCCTRQHSPRHVSHRRSRPLFLHRSRGSKFSLSTSRNLLASRHQKCLWATQQTWDLYRLRLILHLLKGFSPAM